MKVKTCPVSIKAAGTNEGTEDGVFEAIVAAYTLDSVGDKIMPGAFGESLAEWKGRGDPIPVLWSHMSHDPDYHIGVVEEAEERDEGLWVKARLDLDEPKSAKVYKLLKGRRVTQFSFAYDVEDGAYVEEKGAEPHFELRKLRLYEVGPTLIGANQETQLLAVKSAIGAHSTDTSTSAWDGPANEARLDNDAGSATLRRAYAWVDPDRDADSKAAHRFIHHEIGSDGTVGAANTQACVTGIGVLNGGRGGSTIPDSDREGVYRHLAKHLRDAGQDPPELKADVAAAGTASAALSAKDQRFAAEFAQLLAKELLAALRTGTTEHSDEKTATPAQPAAVDEPEGAKADEPARSGPASLLQRCDLDAYLAEV